MCIPDRILNILLFPLIGLIFIRPLSACIIRIWKCCNEEQFGKQTTMGLKLLEIIFQSMVSLHFDQYSPFTLQISGFYPR